MSAFGTHRDDVDAIRDYLNRNEGDLRKTAEGGKVVDEFRIWYRALGTTDWLFRADNVVGEAKWYRNEANRILGKSLPEGQVSADAHRAGETPPPPTNPTPRPSLVPWWVKVGLIAGGVTLGALWWMKDED